MTIDLHSLIAPYALDALDPDERSRFEAHLDVCDDCRAELAGFQATAVRLGDTVSHAPPTALRDRLLAEISTTPQERPVVAALAQRRGLRRTLPRLAVAAALLVVGGVGIGGYVNEHQNAQDEHQRNVAMTSVLSADDVTASDKAFKSGTIKLYASPSADSAVIIAKDLPKLGADKVYQVWMVKGSDPTSQGTFATSGEMIMKGLAGSDHVALTVEPKGGSKQPSGAPVAIIAI